MDDDLKKLLQKYQSGKIALKDELKLSKRLADHLDEDAEQLLRNDIQDHFENSDEENKDLSGVLSEIHHRIHLNQSAQKKSKIRLLYQLASKAAAVLFIPLLLFAVYQWYNAAKPVNGDALVEIVAPRGARITFQLPDGTNGTLNAMSHLSYSPSFSNNRHVALSGEAYFDVAKDKKHPFTISANDNVVKVVGTKFSLSAYPEDKLTELVLEEGKVLFTPSNSNKPIDIIPGERLVSSDRGVEQSKVETWKYTAWKDGRLVFRNDSMEELARRISRWYNVDVHIDDQGLEEYVFRGVFENDSLEEVLRLLKLTSPIAYRIEDRQPNADGSFSKKRVIITKNNN
ncbi:FecR family protein [Mangrovibacterium diazotrophicum]|uniref:FecR family protein n=1 Tax=Mangrovibacterium diazotrophicum TaxID=1261403 RepID=A0A419W2X6_9BACT|nr:FecR domain-containing protein [Mangrovibacterium diazotrophicum]RKD89831.1 FecR family protein [Mangrovibacterium diazotrophicum]